MSTFGRGQGGPEPENSLNYCTDRTLPVLGVREVLCGRTSPKFTRPAFGSAIFEFELGIGRLTIHKS